MVALLLPHQAWLAREARKLEPSRKLHPNAATRWVLTHGATRRTCSLELSRRMPHRRKGEGKTDRSLRGSDLSWYKLSNLNPSSSTLLYNTTW